MESVYKGNNKYCSNDLLTTCDSVSQLMYTCNIALTHPLRARVGHPWSKPYTSQRDGGMLKSASGVREECLHRHTPRQEVRLSLRL